MAYQSVKCALCELLVNKEWQLLLQQPIEEPNVIVRGNLLLSVLHAGRYHTCTQIGTRTRNAWMIAS